MSRKVLVVDPPSGWMYGFPKECPDLETVSDDVKYTAWLIKQGYPENLIDSALRHSRYWETEVDE